MSTVTITRSFDVPPERLFAAWTEPNQIARWYGPEQFDAPVDRITVDLRPGGRWALTMVRRDGSGEFTIGYDIVEIDPPSLLVMRSDPMPHMPEPTVVRVEITAADAGSTLALTDGPMPDAGVAAADAGYHAALDKLTALVSTA